MSLHRQPTAQSGGRLPRNDGGIFVARDNTDKGENSLLIINSAKYYLMRTFIYIFLLMILASCERLRHEDVRRNTVVHNYQIAVGEVDTITVKSENYSGVMENSGSISPAFIRYENGVKFTLCKDENEKITYISTSDRAFLSDSGIYLSMAYNDIKNLIRDTSINYAPGWGAFVELNSGWSAMFNWELYNSEKKTLSDKAKIIAFFKSKWYSRFH